MTIKIVVYVLENIWAASSIGVLYIWVLLLYWAFFEMFVNIYIFLSKYSVYSYVQTVKVM